MTESIALNDAFILDLKNLQDKSIIEKVADSFKEQFKDVDFNEPDSTTQDYAKLLNQATMTIKNFTNAHYKTTKSLDLTELEQIKNALKNFKCNSERVEAFKKEIMTDLDTFQSKIRSQYVEKITELERKRKLYTRQINVYEKEKNQLIMQRLSRIVWPYDEKTKQYEEKIATLQNHLAMLERQIEREKLQRPFANEKDVIIYEMHLKEKFSPFFLD